MKYKYSIRCKYCLLIWVFVECKSILYFTIAWIVYRERIVERTRAILNFNACAVCMKPTWNPFFPWACTVLRKNRRTFGENLISFKLWKTTANNTSHDRRNVGSWTPTLQIAFIYLEHKVTSNDVSLCYRATKPKKGSLELALMSTLISLSHFSVFELKCKLVKPWQPHEQIKDVGQTEISPMKTDKELQSLLKFSMLAFKSNASEGTNKILVKDKRILTMTRVDIQYDNRFSHREESYLFLF